MILRRALAALTATLVAVAIAAPSALAERQITVLPNNYTTSCFPFGDSGLLLQDWKPYMAFVYKNIPSFEVKSGDTLAFDTAAVNDGTVQLQIDLAPTTSNGSDVQAQPFKQVVSNTQTPANPTGDTSVGNFDMRFKTEAPFSFPGGGLIIRFSNPSAAYLTDVSCTPVGVGGASSDPTGAFVERGYADPDGVAPWSNADPNDVGAFQLTTAATFALAQAEAEQEEGDRAGPGRGPECRSPHPGGQGRGQAELTEGRRLRQGRWRGRNQPPGQAEGQDEERAEPFRPRERQRQDHLHAELRQSPQRTAEDQAEEALDLPV